MGFTSRSEYAILAVYELSKVFSMGKTVSAQEIARKHRLSASFLLQTLRRLRAAGLVDAERGAQGGYKLLYSPDDVTIGYVVALSSPTTIENSAPFRKKSVGKNAAFPSRNGEKVETQVRVNLDTIWNQGEAKRQEFLNGITFSGLVSMESSPGTSLNFTI